MQTSKTIILLFFLVTIFVWHYTLQILFNRFSEESQKKFAPIMFFIRMMLLLSATIIVGSMIWRLI